MTVTRFDGSSLPPGWTATEPALGHVVVSGGYLRLQSDPGADFNNLSSGGNNAPEGPRVSIAVPGAGFDFAVGLGNAVNSAEFQSFEMTGWDENTQSGIRFSQYIGEVTGRDPGWFGRRQTTVTANITQAAAPAPLYGPRAFMRMTRDAGTGVYTFRSSHTGKPGTWFTHSSVTDAFIPTEFLLGMTAATPDANGRELRFATFVDMSTQPIPDDATTPPEPTVWSDILNVDLSGESFPPQIVTSTNAGGSILVLGGVASLDIDMNQLDSYVWLQLDPSIVLPRNHGCVMRYNYEAAPLNSFAAIILRASETTDLPGAQVLPDKYRPGVGILAEINGTNDTVRILTATPTAVGETFDGSGMEFYGFANKIEDADSNADPGTDLYMRMEIIDGYFRVRFWPETVQPEPTTWDYEGEDWTQNGLSWAFAWSHNDSTVGTPGTGRIELSEIDLYEVSTGTAVVGNIAAFQLQAGVEVPVQAYELQAGVEVSLGFDEVSP